MSISLDEPVIFSEVPRILLDDVDRYAGYVEQLRTDLSLIRSSGDFAFSGQFVGLKDFGVSLGHWGTPTRLRGHMSSHTISFPLRGRALVKGSGWVEHNESALILGVDRPQVDLEMGRNFSNIALTFENTVFRDHLRALVGVEKVELALDVAIDLRSSSGKYLQKLAHFMVAELERRPTERSTPGAFLALRENFIHALLATQLRSSAFEQPTSDVGERRVQLLEAYIEEHLADPLTLGELATQAGVSVRAVQLAFRRYRGLSPAQFLRNRRLERAARMLRADIGPLTILDVALDCGFTHTGRFARNYRERFGELPGETLRRCRHVVSPGTGQAPPSSR